MVRNLIASEEALFLIASILSDTNARAPTFNSLTIAGREVAAKTGTTDNSRDAWTMGFVPNLAVGVWLGNNENAPMSGVAGASGAGAIWRNSMQRFLRDLPVEKFSRPSTITQVLVCQSNGLRATASFSGTHSEYFIQGTIPEGTCSPPRIQKKEEKKDDKKDEEKEEDDEKPEGGRGGGPDPKPKEPPEEDDDNPPQPLPDPEPTGPPQPPPPPPTGDTSP